MASALLLKNFVTLLAAIIELVRTLDVTISPAAAAVAFAVAVWH